jgi:hypothetical protein
MRLEARPQAQPAQQAGGSPLIIGDDLRTEAEQPGAVDRAVLDMKLAARLGSNDHPVAASQHLKRPCYGPRALRYVRSSSPIRVKRIRIPVVAFEAKSRLARMPIMVIPVSDILENSKSLPQIFGKCPILALPVCRRMVF